MGAGPFRARCGRALALLSSEQVISGIREIWVRNVYLQHGYLEIAPDAVVVDLGANTGAFTMLALAHGPGVKVVSVEPHRVHAAALRRQAALNGWAGRVALEPCFIGGGGGVPREILENPGCSGAGFLDQESFVRKHRLERIDFLKCDIEGGEFELFAAESPLLEITRQLAMEVHGHAGDRHAFIRALERRGFEVGRVIHHADDCIVCARRSAASTSSWRPSTTTAAPAPGRSPS